MELGDRFVAAGEDSSMGLPYLTSFFWCMSLKFGSRLVGVMHLLFSITMVVVCGVMAYEASLCVGSSEDADRVYTRTFYISLSVSVLSVSHVVLSSILIYGAFWSKLRFLRIWLLVMLSLFVAAVTFVVVTAAMHGFSATGSDIFLNFLQGLLIFSFIGYCILCVYSYYLMLKSAEDMDRPKKIDHGAH